MTSTTTRASAADTARLLSAVLLPTLAGGVIKRRPLPLRLPGREVAVLLSPEDVGAVLDATPDPFNPASTRTKSVR